MIKLPTKKISQSDRLRIEQTALGDFLYFMHSETPAATPRFGPIPGSPEPSYAMVIRPHHPTGRAKIEESDTGSDTEEEDFSLIDSFQQLQIPSCPTPAVKQPAKEPSLVPVPTSFEYWAKHEDMNEWNSVESYSEAGAYRQRDINDSSATIKPLELASAATQTQVTIEEDDSSDDDFEWSVIDKPVTKAVNSAQASAR